MIVMTDGTSAMSGPLLMAKDFLEFLPDGPRRFLPPEILRALE